MNIFLLFYMCHFAMGLTHCYKTTVFLHFSTICQVANCTFQWIELHIITLCITLNAKTGKIVLVTLCIQIVMFVWCETFPRCLSIDGWTALGYYNYARNHNQQYTQKLNIQQQSIYKITMVNIHKQISFFPPGFEPQTSGSLARKSSMLSLGHPVIPVWCFISWKAPEVR